MSKNIGKNISKSLSNNYSQKFLDHAKQSTTDEVKIVSIKAIQKPAKATGDLISNKIADKITKVLGSSLQNNSETVRNDAKIN